MSSKIAETPCTAKENDDAVIGDIATAEERVRIGQLRAELAPHLEAHLTPEERAYSELTGDLRLLRFLRGYKGVISDALAVRSRLRDPHTLRPPPSPTARPTCLRPRVRTRATRQHEQAYVKTLKWYQADKIGDIRRDILARQLTLSTLPHSELVHKHYYTNVWHNEDRDGNLLNYELTGRVRRRARRRARRAGCRACPGRAQHSGGPRGHQALRRPAGAGRGEPRRARR